MIDYTQAFINGNFETEFRQRENTIHWLNNKLKRIEKQSKKTKSKSKENLQRWFK